MYLACKTARFRGLKVVRQRRYLWQFDSFVTKLAKDYQSALSKSHNEQQSLSYNELNGSRRTSRAFQNQGMWLWLRWELEFWSGRRSGIGRLGKESAYEPQGTYRTDASFSSQIDLPQEHQQR